MRFEWDLDKAERNLRKHGVSFDEASTVFEDSLARFFPDDIHSDEEVRLGLIGYSDVSRLLIVSFTDRGNDIIRIISARPLTPKEARYHAN